MRAAAIIVRYFSIALIERLRSGQHYFIFPGGQVEEGESQIEAVAREVKEELGLDVLDQDLVAEVIFNSRSQFYYLVDVIGGDFGTGQGDEMIGFSPKENGTYAAVWLPLSEFSKRDVRLKAIAEMVLQMPCSWLAKKAFTESRC